MRSEMIVHSHVYRSTRHVDVVVKQPIVLLEHHRNQIDCIPVRHHTAHATSSLPPSLPSLPYTTL